MGLYEDSRGQSLADGDFVLCFNPNESEFKFYEGRIVSSQGLLMVRLLENALDLQLKSDIYVLKMDAKSTFINLRHEIDRLLNIVDKFTIDTTWIPSVKSRLLSIKTFEDVAKSWMFILYGAYANIYQAECMYHSLNISEDILSDYYLSIMSIRGTYIRDVCGNKINLGDLVVTYNKSNRNYCYGVVISETEILTENHRKRKESEVYKILNLTAEEKQMQQALLKSSLKSEKGKGKQVMKIGQVYETAYDYYIYLGKCRLDVGYAGESNVVLKSNYVEFPEEVFLYCKIWYFKCEL
jgi:hypothetical protein